MSTSTDCANDEHKSTTSDFDCPTISDDAPSSEADEGEEDQDADYVKIEPEESPEEGIAPYFKTEEARRAFEETRRRMLKIRRDWIRSDDTQWRIWWKEMVRQNK